MFVFPAVIAAFIVSFPMIYVIYSWIFSSDLGYMPSVVPTGNAVFWAFWIGILIPLVSSIVPIRRGLSANLTETLDVTRSKTKGTIITTFNNKAINIAPYLFKGSLAVANGVIVYYLLPVALLELNIALILTVFFTLLLGMLKGLVLLAVNLQSWLEYVLLNILLFWEK